MRRLVVVILSMACTSLLTTGAALADATLRDRYGRREATIGRDPVSKDLVIRDTYGRRLGTVDRDPVTGNGVLRDTHGRRLGTIEPKERPGSGWRDRQR